MAANAQVSSTLVGRRDELEALMERRRAAARGYGALVLIEGEAGIGKTRLVKSFCETLTHGRATFGIGICREFGNMPFGPIREALRGIGCETSPPNATTRAEELIDLRARLAAATRRIAVLVLEDIQWADEGTLSFLHYLLSSVTAMRLLVVATLREDELLDRNVSTYLSRIARDRATIRISLGPLPQTEIRSLIRSAPGGATLPATQLEEIVERAEGNPFFAEELLATALEEGPAHVGMRGLPRTVEAAVME
ncbi:MAG: AAA family ATPase, partial [Candidatus Eremiobacteraeota bacterium]|nr:AAA family ATPase [Candidatus Eremiobacteraeota bacterium]